MKYQEAVEQKKSCKSQIENDGMIFDVWIVPSLRTDLSKYLKNHGTSPVTDETAIEFSSDNEFQVCGIWADGANIVWKELIKLEGN